MTEILQATRMVVTQPSPGEICVILCDDRGPVAQVALNSGEAVLRGHSLIAAARSKSDSANTSGQWGKILDKEIG